MSVSGRSAVGTFASVPGAADRFSLDGRIALVTGASSGLGEATARALHDAGARVAVTARRTERIEALAADIDGVAVPCDLLDLDGVRALLPSVVDALGAPSVVVSVAGGFDDGHPAEAEPLEVIERTLRLNLVAPYLLAQAAFPHLVEAGGGSIVHVSSISGHVGIPGIPQASYAASKAGLSGLTVELAVQWASHRIRVEHRGPRVLPQRDHGTAVRQRAGAGLAATQHAPSRRRHGRRRGRRDPVAGQRRRPVRHRADDPGRRRLDRPLRGERTMLDYDMGDDVAALRGELRRLVADEIPTGYLGAFTDDPADLEVAQRFCRTLADRGLLCLAWPEEYGGRGASLWAQTAVREEMWAHHEPRGAQYMGVNWVGPTIMRHGTDAQQRAAPPAPSPPARSSGARASASPTPAPTWRR